MAKSMAPTGNGSRPCAIQPNGMSGSKQGHTVAQYLPSRPGGGMASSGTAGNSHKVQMPKLGR